MAEFIVGHLSLYQYFCKFPMWTNKMLQLVVGNMGWTIKNKLEKWDHIFCVGQLSTKKLEK